MSEEFDAGLVIEKLWLGSEDAAQCDISFLFERNIKNILVCGFGISQIHPPNEINYYKINAIDLPVFNILKYADETFHFIEKSLSSSSSTLVHCARGKSRSACIVILYLMRKMKITYEESFSIVKKARPFISLNSGFVDLCKLYYKMDFNLVGNSPAHLQYYQTFHLPIPQI